MITTVIALKNKTKKLPSTTFPFNNMKSVTDRQCFSDFETYVEESIGFWILELTPMFRSGCRTCCAEKQCFDYWVTAGITVVLMINEDTFVDLCWSSLLQLSLESDNLEGGY